MCRFTLNVHPIIDLYPFNFKFLKTLFILMFKIFEKITIYVLDASR